VASAAVFTDVPLYSAVGYSTGLDTTIAVGGQVFRPQLNNGPNSVAKAEHSTCSELTLTAGLNDRASGDSAIVEMQVTAGTTGGGRLEVTRGKLATATFTMQPGTDWLLTFSGNAVVYTTGKLTCSTAIGRTSGN
jgi:hypothetical protein